MAWIQSLARELPYAAGTTKKKKKKKKKKKEINSRERIFWEVLVVVKAIQRKSLLN